MGDSGSPAIWKHKNKDYLIGILSEDDNKCEIVKDKTKLVTKVWIWDPFIP